MLSELRRTIFQRWLRGIRCSMDLLPSTATSSGSILSRSVMVEAAMVSPYTAK